MRGALSSDECTRPPVLAPRLCARLGSALEYGRRRAQFVRVGDDRGRRGNACVPLKERVGVLATLSSCVRVLFYPFPRSVAEISLTWVGAGEKLPVMLFRADIVHKLQGPLTKPLESKSLYLVCNYSPSPSDL